MCESVQVLVNLMLRGCAQKGICVSVYFNILGFFPHAHAQHSQVIADTHTHTLSHLPVSSINGKSAA